MEAPTRPEPPSGRVHVASSGIERSSAELLGFLRQAVTNLSQTVAMVTHDPVAAGYADRVLFLADGRIVDEMRSPTADSVLDYMKRLGG